MDGDEDEDKLQWNAKDFIMELIYQRFKNDTMKAIKSMTDQQSFGPFILSMLQLGYRLYGTGSVPGTNSVT